MNRTRKLIAGGLVVIAGAAIGTGIASAGGGDDAEAPITGTDLERARGAALAHTGEGTVTDTEVGDEESLYEVEVTLDDGTQVDVQLDEDFAVVGTGADGADGADDETGDDD